MSEEFVELSNLDRLKARISYDSTKVANDNILRRVITGASGAVIRYLNRHILEAARVEQYDIEPLQNSIILKGYPIVSGPTFVNSVNRDFTLGSSISAETFYAKASNGVVTFTGFQPSWGPGVLQATYTGGMGLAVFRLKGTAGTVSGTFAVPNVAIGQSSGARGVIREITSGVTVELDVLSGLFIAGETLKDETGAGTVQLATITQTPIVMKFPDPIHITEDWMSDLWKTKDRKGVTSLSAEGGSLTFVPTRFDMPKGVKDRLRHYRRRSRRGV